MPTFWWSAAALVPTGLAMLSVTTAANASVQLGVAPTMRGRVMSLYLDLLPRRHAVRRPARRLARRGWPGRAGGWSAAGSSACSAVVGAGRRRSARHRGLRCRPTVAELVHGPGALALLHDGAMRVEQLTDPADPRLDDFRDLTDADVRPDRRGIVIAEGSNVVERLASSPYRMRAVLGVPGRHRGPGAGARRARRDRRTRSTSGCCPRSSASGSPAACSRRPTGSPPATRRAAGRRPPGGRARGAQRLREPGLAVPQRRRVRCRRACCSTRPAPTRSTAAACGSRWATCCGCRSRCCPAPWPAALGLLREHGVTTLRADAAAASTTLRRVDVAGALGGAARGRGPGLPAATLAAADVRVRIPMADGVDSLNVATAAAVAFAQLG